MTLFIVAVGLVYILCLIGIGYGSTNVSMINKSKSELVTNYSSGLSATSSNLSSQYDIASIAKKPSATNFMYDNDLEQLSMEVKNIIMTEDAHSAISVNPDSNMVYLPTSDGNVFVIDGKSDRITKKILLNGSSSLTDVQINPRNNKVYVSDFLSDMVFIIDGKTNQPVGEVNVDGAYYMAFNPKTNLLYINSIGSRTINILDSMNDTIIDTITLPKFSDEEDALSGPVKMAVNPNTNLIYVTLLNSNYVPVINASENRMVASITINSPEDIAVNPNTNLVYISNYYANRISVIKGDTNYVNNTIIGNYTIPTPEGSSIEVDQSTNTVYLANPAADSVTLVNGSTNKARNTILVGNYPTDLAVNPKNGKVYTTNLENSVSVIVQTPDKTISGTPEASQSTLIDGIVVKDDPIDLAINPKTNLLYVIYSSSNTIDIIDGNKDRIIDSITLPSYASAVAVNPLLNSIYVAIPDIQSLITINGETNRVINATDVGVTVRDIAADPATNLLFLSTNNSILTMNSMTKEISSNDTINDYRDFAIDSNLRLVYVTLPLENAINTTDGSYMIRIGISPSLIAVNPNTNILYVVDDISHILYAIDTYSNSTLKIPLSGAFLSENDIDLNTFTNTIYVTEPFTGDLAVINGSTNAVSIVPVGSAPTKIAINPQTNLIYIADTGSGRISVLNGKTSKVTVGVTFNTNPPGSGLIKCNEQNILMNRSAKYDIGTECKAEAKTGFAFDSWVGNLHNSNNDSLIISQFGTTTANFIHQPTFVEEYGNVISGIALASFIIIPVVFSVRPSILSNVGTTVFSNNINRMPKLAHISNTDILGINVAIIAGVLIFLSLEGFEGSEETQISVVTANIVFPFAISAIVTLLKYEKFGIRLMIAGFVNLMVSIILISFMRL